MKYVGFNRLKTYSEISENDFLLSRENPDVIYFPTDMDCIITGGKEYGKQPELVYDTIPTEGSENLLTSGTIKSLLEGIQEQYQRLYQKLNEVIVSGTTLEVSVTPGGVEIGQTTKVTVKVSSSRSLDKISLYRGGRLVSTQESTSGFQLEDEIQGSEIYSAVGLVGDTEIMSQEVLVEGLRSKTIYWGLRDASPESSVINNSEVLQGTKVKASRYPVTIEASGDAFCKWWAIPVSLKITSFKDELGVEDDSYKKAPGAIEIDGESYWIYYLYTQIVNSTSYTVKLEYGD